MALLKTVVRKYTPPTCTLEVRGQESLLSKWAGRTILQDLKFKLSFDDPRQPDDKQVTIWGDRVGLEALSTTVTEYVHNFLQSKDGSIETNGKEPIVDALPRQKIKPRQLKDLATTEIKPNAAVVEDSAPTKVIPISPIFQNQTLNPYLKPKGLVTHELFLGALQTPESGASIDLSALQLFDLATALDACTAEMLHLPTLGKERPRIPLWAYGAGAAAAIAAAVGLAPAAIRLAQTSNSTLVVVPPAGENSQVTALNPNSEAAIVPANPASPTPLGSPLPGGTVSPNSNLPFGSAPPVGQAIPSVGGSPGAVPPPGAIAPPGATVLPGNTSVNSPVGVLPNRQPGFPTGLTPNTPPASQTQKPLGQQTRSFDIASAGSSQPTYGITKDLDPAFGRSQSSVSSSTSRKNTFLRSTNPRSVGTSAKPKPPQVTRRSSTPTLSARGKVDPNVSNTVLTDNSGSGLSAFSSTTATSQNSKPSTSRSNRSKPQKNPVRSASKQPQPETQIPAINDSNIAFGASSVAPTADFNFSSPAISEPSAIVASPDTVEPEFSFNSSSPNPTVSPSESQNTPPEIGSLPTLSDRNSGSQTPAVSSSSPPPGAISLTVPSPSAVPAPGDAAILSTPSTNLGSSSTYIGAASSFNSIQAGELKRYFEGQWKPIQGVKESLDYTLEINPNGSINRILPIKEVSRQYIERTGMPKLTNTPMVSPIGGGRTIKVRVVLEPDGTVKTAQEQ